MSKTKAFMAIITTPLGVWDSTATVCVGHEAEARARRWAQNKFIAECLPPFMRKGVDGAHYALWSLAQENGCKCIVQEVEIEDTAKRQ
jgi:hypothetical protein